MKTDDGFTVVELMIAMMVMVILTVPLVSSFVLGVSVTGTGGQDATNSADAQLVASYFETDISSSETVQAGASCAPEVGGTPLVQLQWKDGTDTRTVAYRLLPNAVATADLGATVQQLERHECTSPTGPSVARAVLARSVITPTTVACDGATCASTASRPRRVELVVSEAARPAGGAPFVIRLQSTRKVRP